MDGYRLHYTRQQFLEEAYELGMEGEQASSYATHEVAAQQFELAEAEREIEQEELDPLDAATGETRR